MKFQLFCVVLILSYSNSFCFYIDNGGSLIQQLNESTVVKRLKDLTEILVLETDNAQPCLAGWIQRNNYCYKFFSNELKTFDEAEAFCRSYDGHLASVTTSDEHDFLLDYILRDSTIENLRYIWVGARRFKLRYIWMDLEPFSYARWHPMHDIYTDTAYPSYNCVQFVSAAAHYDTDINFGKLINHPCTLKDNFICKQESKK